MDIAGWGLLPTRWSTLVWVCREKRIVARIPAERGTLLYDSLNNIDCYCIVISIQALEKSSHKSWLSGRRTKSVKYFTDPSILLDVGLMHP